MQLAKTRRCRHPPISGWCSAVLSRCTNWFGRDLFDTTTDVTGPYGSTAGSNGFLQATRVYHVCTCPLTTKAVGLQAPLLFLCVQVYGQYGLMYKNRWLPSCSPSTLGGHVPSKSRQAGRSTPNLWEFERIYRCGLQVPL